MDGLTSTATPIFAQTQEQAPVPDDAPVIDLARLNLKDPFERTLWAMVTTYRKKRGDYTERDSSPWQNFDITEEQENIPWGASVQYEISKKRARLRALRGREPQNESIRDTHEDIAVYAAIALARYMYPNGHVN